MHLCADEAGVAGPAADGERQHEVGEARTEKGGEGDGQKNARQGQKGVHGKGGEGGIDPAAEIARKAADGEAEGERNGNHSDGDGERKARAPQQTRERVAAQLVSAGPVRGRGAFEAVRRD